MKPHYALASLLLFGATLTGCSSEEPVAAETATTPPGFPVQLAQDKNGITHVYGYKGDEIGTVNAPDVCSTQNGLFDPKNPVKIEMYVYNPATNGETLYLKVDCNGEDTKVTMGS